MRAADVTRARRSVEAATAYLRRAGSPGARLLTGCHLLAEPCEPRVIADLTEVASLLRGQNPDGSWGKQGGYPLWHRPMVETFKRLRLLVGRYELDAREPTVQQAAEYLFGLQTEAGDFRGMIGDQYATYYTGEFTALLVRAGYADDPRIERAFGWLLSMRQDDGGWTVPLGTHRFSRGEILSLTGAPSAPVEPDRTRPSSHNWTDMVLRAFAAHPARRADPAAASAAAILKTQFFEPDAYGSYGEPRYWVRFVFWWPNLLTALESLVELGFGAADPDMWRAAVWFLDHQRADGSWRTAYPPNPVDARADEREAPWVSLRVARTLARLTGTRGS